MKKIVIGAVAMGGAALIAFGASGTFAAFNATATVENQSAGAGTLDVKVDGGQITAAPSALKLEPKESTQFAYWVNNVGDMAGSLTADLTITQKAENGCNDPEKSVDTSCSEWSAGGEFSQYATVEFLRNTVATDAVSCKTQTTGMAISPVVTLDTAAAAPAVPVFDLAGGAGACVVARVTLPENVTNVVQGDSATMSAVVTLTQK